MMCLNLAVMLVSVLWLALVTPVTPVSSSDTLNDGRRSIIDGETLVSAGGTFTLGFFSPGTPKRRYLGIWFSTSVDAVIWVANRDSSLNDTTGMLLINVTVGSLLLLDGSGQTAWTSSNTTGSNSSSASAEVQLHGSGNLVVHDQSSGVILWQSFDHPSNTLVAGMRLGMNPQTGAEWSLTSWRSPTDPSTGDYRRVLDTRGLPDCVSWRDGTKKFRTGPWNGLYFSGVPEMASYSGIFPNEVIVRPDEIAYVYNVNAMSTAGTPLSRIVLGEAGVLQRLVWDPNIRVWNLFAQSPRDVCDDYGKCGTFGLCDVNMASTLFCGCVEGFSPVSPARWAMRETSVGCRRKTPLECRNREGGGTSTTDGFAVVRGVKLPDTDNTTATLEECRVKCLADCSCVAFAAKDIRGGDILSGCVMWMGNIVDVRYVDKGQDLYVRLAKSELVNKKSRRMLKILVPVMVCLLVLTCIFLVWICKFTGMSRNKDIQEKTMIGGTSNDLGDENIELPFVSFRDIVTATNDFSNDNLLGQGDFGKVYKGILDDDKEVAIKRLSKSSGQGVQEFRNEVLLIAKLQHRNLVRLLGCCIHGDERLLIYEYLPNKSLDIFIFGTLSYKQETQQYCQYMMFPNLRAMLVVSVLCFSLVTSGSGSSSSSDTLNDGRRNITDGQTLVSAGGTFTLGFFSPGTPILRYLGIWFSASKDAVVWVANRDSPLNDTSGALTIKVTTAILLLLDGSGHTAWSNNTTTNNSSSSSTAAAAQLLESGNLVVLRGGAVVWQSFDHPSNTLIAGMRLGVNPQTGAEWALTSWKYPTDPSTGDCRRAMDTRGLPDCVTWRGGAKKYRTGPWNGLYFSGVPEMASYSDMFTNEVVVRPDEVAYVFDAKPSSSASAKPPFSRLVLGEAGVLQRLVWDPASKVWNVFAQRDVCDEYGRCGKFGLCDVNTPSTLFCGCVAGFGPVDAAQWAIREASAGCRRNVPLDCRAGGGTTDGFKAVRGVKLPDTDNTTVDMAATVEECRARCLANCSCVAFAAADIMGGGEGSGCVMWVGDIVDVRYVDKGQDLYVRLAKSELVTKSRRGMLKILLPVTACLLVLACIFLVWICKFRGMRRNKDIQKKAMLSASTELGDENIELPFVSFRDIVTATNDFSNDNMLGQGGFGKVYKGVLEDDKEVAIKRLSKNSRQGAEEFRNEVVLIAKLQHRNLVRLLGYCIHGDERLLIYECLPNKSLDVFIFDPASKYVLDWPTRSQIIKGVARGLLYLHQDSRLTIIHRDLKSSNILLDVDMSPKISDFGMARIFGRDQQEANTNRVVGTYGYMSPEYAMDGTFSVKSDTYSFGVILLEIISGLKISLRRLSDFPNLLAYAWNLWKGGKPMDMVDPSIADNCSPTEVLRCIHIGLLCVQDNPNNRPLMSSVVFMLENETTALATPKQPVYFAQRDSEAKEIGENNSSSMNSMNLTVLEGR